jgi:GNAT superfamily N-acetyltransferase
MSDWRIHKLAPGDELLLGSLAIDADEFEEETIERTPRPLGQADASAFLEDPTTHMWAALADELPVGLVLAYVLRRRHGDPKQLFVYELATRRGWRRQGVATALIQQMLEWARSTDLQRGFVYTGQTNATAIAFYKSLGWQAEAEADLVFALDLDSS